MARPLTVLQAVSDAAIEIGISQVPLLHAMSSKEEDIVQMTSLLKSVADDILLDEVYQDVLGDGMWLMSATGSATYDRPQQDTDIILFDGRLAVNGLKYKFLQAKGLEFGEQMRDFITRQNRLAVRANDRVLDLDIEEGRIV